MLTRFATAALAISLLGASAFALPLLGQAGGTAGTATGVTVVEKNSAWPLKESMSMDPCTVRFCQEA